MTVVCIDSLSFGTAANISSLPSKLGSQKGSLRCCQESPLKLQCSSWRYSVLIHWLVVISWRETVSVETRVCTCGPIFIKYLPILDCLSSPWSHLFFSVLLLSRYLNPLNLYILTLFFLNQWYRQLFGFTTTICSIHRGPCQVLAFDCTLCSCA